MTEPSSTPELAPEELLAEAGWMRSMARALVLDPNRADDVVQEAWLAALEHPPADRRNLRGWLARVLRNAALQIDRSEGRRRERERRAARAEASRSDEEVRERADLRRFLVESVLALDEPYRTTLLLRHFEGLSTREIAARQDVSGTLVRTRLARGLDQLRVRLDRRHGGDRRAWGLALCPLARTSTGGAVQATGWSLGALAAAALVLAGGVWLAAIALVEGEEVSPDSQLAVHESEAMRSSETRDLAPAVAPSTRSRMPVAAGHSATTEEAEAADAPGAVAPPPTASALEGRVTDFETGAPVAGAEIHWGPDVGGPQEALAHSAADGRFRLASAPGAEPCLIALAEGYAGVRRVFELEEAGDGPVELQLVRGVTIEGTVADREGHPLEGAELFLKSAEFPAGFDPLASGIRKSLSGLPAGSWLFEGRSPNRRRVAWRRVARSDSRGRFRISGLIANTGASCVRVHAEHADFAPAASEVLTLRMPSGVVSTALTLDRGASIRGVVRQAGGGARAEVGWTGVGETHGSTETDDEGRYTLANVTPGPVQVIASDPRYFRVREQRELELSPGEERFEDFDLSHDSHELSGRVVDSGGTGVEGARLIVIGRGAGGWEVSHAESAADGHWSAGLPHLEGRTYDVELNHGPLHLSRTGLPRGAEGVDFRLPDLARLHLEIVDGAAGGEVAEYELYWRPSGAPDFRAHRGERDVNGGLPFPVGSVDLLVCAHEAGYPGTTVEGVEVSADASGTVARIELQAGTRLTLTWSGEEPGTPEHHLLFFLTDELWPLVDGERNGYLGFDFDLRGRDEFVHHEIQRLSIAPDHWSNSLDASASVTLDGVAPGRYRIKSIPDDILFEPAEIVVPASRSANATIHWRPKNP